MKNAGGRDRAAGISFRHLKVFKAIGHSRSVRQAAIDCALSQPAVAQALYKLEEVAGLPLVNARADGSSLNVAGQVLHRRVERFFKQSEVALIKLGSAVDEKAADCVMSRITRSQIRAFSAVSDSGSFAQAALKLEISQQAIQKSVRELEANLHKTLYFRTAAGLIVSKGGLEFARRMKLAAQEIDWGFDEIAAHHGHAKVNISVGAKHFGGTIMLNSVLHEFLRLQPKADVKIIHGAAAEMLAKLRCGEVDCVVGLLPQTPSKDLINDAEARTSYCVAGRKGHPLLRKTRITLKDISAFSWVVGESGSKRRLCFESLFGDQPSPPSVTTSSLTIIRHLLASDDRLTLMTSYELAHEKDTLEALPFQAISHTPVMGVTRRANWLPTQLHADFVEAVRKHMLTPDMQSVFQRTG